MDTRNTVSVQFNDVEVIEIYEKIWNADIINKSEPLYSIATSVVKLWSSYDSLFNERHVLSYILSQKLIAHWTHVLFDHIKHRIVGGVLDKTQLDDILSELRAKYKDDDIMRTIVIKLKTSFVHISSLHDINDIN